MTPPAPRAAEAAAGTLTRRERQREATYAEIVTASRALLEEGAELSLRAVATRMGMTAPALYRYVASYQELVDLVAYEIDRAATDQIRAGLDDLPADDHAGRLVVASARFRRWALDRPREFQVAFANPIADTSCVRRELLTLSSSGHLFTGIMCDLWLATGFPVPALDDLPPAVRESVVDPLIPAEADRVPHEHRGLLWIYMLGWSMLYGTVALEVMGHMDPRVIESGEMFVQRVVDFAPYMALEHDVERLTGLVRANLH